MKARLQYYLPGVFGQPQSQFIIANRFEKCNELRQLVPLIKALQDKDEELHAAAAQKGAASVDFRKRNVIAPLRRQVDRVIEDFNSVLPKADETDDIMVLVERLAPLVSQVQENHMSLLMTPRDQRRAAANTTVQGTAVGVAVGAALGMTFFSGACTVLGASTLANYGREKSGLSNLTPKSAQIVNEMAETLKGIKTNLIEMKELRVRNNIGKL